MKRAIMSGITLVFLAGLWMCARAGKDLQMTEAVKEEILSDRETETVEEEESSGLVNLESLEVGGSFTVTQSGRLREDMPEFTFLLEAHFDLKMGNYAVDSIAVYNGDTLLQTISIPELTLYGQTRTNEDKIDTLGFVLEDLNFDGYQDIRLYDTFAGNSSQEWIYLVWDPELGIFENDERLKQILGRFIGEDKSE